MLAERFYRNGETIAITARAGCWRSPQACRHSNSQERLEARAGGVWDWRSLQTSSSFHFGEDPDDD